MIRSVHGRVSVPGAHPTTGEITGAFRVRARQVLMSVLPVLRLPLDEQLEPGTEPRVEAADPQLSALAQYAAVLESCALAHARGSHEVYSSTIARLTHSLDSNGAHVVRKYPVSALCNLSHRRLQEETAHEKRDAAIVARVNRLIDQARAQDMRAKDRAKSVVVDQAIRCPRCKTQDGITRMPVQANSADEGMKTACMCAGCGKQWEIAS